MPVSGPSVGAVVVDVAVVPLVVGVPVARSVAPTVVVVPLPDDVSVVVEVLGGVVGAVVGVPVLVGVPVGEVVGAVVGAVVVVRTGSVVGAGRDVAARVSDGVRVVVRVPVAAARGGGVTTPGGTVTGESSVGAEGRPCARTGCVASAWVVGVTRPRTEVDTLGAVRTGPPEPRVGTSGTSSAVTPDGGRTSMRCWTADTTAAAVRTTAASTATASAGCGERRVDEDRAAPAMAPPH
jgi:hypothetical protein